jgi:hypothetical protein
MDLTLRGADTAKQAAEPVFSFADKVTLQNFRSVFRTGLNDPALLNAVMLTFAFAVTGGVMDRECLGYQTQAMSSIRERLSLSNGAVSTTTLGAILLLAGVEVCPLSPSHNSALQTLHIKG